MASSTASRAVAANMPGGFSNNDIRLLAQAVYGEARGEPYEGQVAIAAVILNRLNSPLFPNSVAGAPATEFGNNGLFKRFKMTAAIATCPSYGSPRASP